MLTLCDKVVRDEEGGETHCALWRAQLSKSTPVRTKTINAAFA
ncbi:hypothetical protein BFV94_1838 [Alteromonas macleodii]|uniref:Uncharacterized protein n=1 Tax=Alteromonas macleodii TaxID=28108 RepID=A0AB36G160_ALTMA|nr:hypothetical protein BFV95_1836 [Alteromonas macleodii]OES35501.1 hypothetical protein BFV94_1838 [Alteromonas macleodii]OES42479.1 hypothetical protein BFV96_1838 [Alteromonas macleodii]